MVKVLQNILPLGSIPAMILTDACDNDARTTTSNVAIAVRGHAVAPTFACLLHAHAALARAPSRCEVSGSAVVRC
jgi:hypothetical protein